MKKGFLLIVIWVLFMGCVSNQKMVLNPNCLALDKKLAELKNEKRFNSTYLLTRMALSNNVGMVNENSLDKEIQVSEVELNRCKQ